MLTTNTFAMSPSAFTCAQCNECFESDLVLQQHIKQSHASASLPVFLLILPRTEPSVPLPTPPPPPPPSTCVVGQNDPPLVIANKFQCLHCDKNFSANRSLRKHVKLSHVGQELPVVRMGRKPKEKLENRLSNITRITTYKKRKSTKATTRSNVPLMCHLKKEVLYFHSVAEFESWKLQEEDAVIARFVKARGDRMINGTIIKNFYCHRSGHYMPLHRQRKRRTKIKGSCKIGARCPASMFVKINPTGQVRVAYCSEHRGHEFDVFHIGLRKKQREQLANKLASGMSFDEVLNSCCENGSTAESIPVTKKDLENICREFGVDKKKYICADVEDNVAEWIEVTTQDLETLQSDCNTERYLAACDSAYSFVRTAMQQSLHLAEMASEHLENLRTLFVAEMSKSQ